MTKRTQCLILASASPRRRRLLDNVGAQFEVHTSDVDEHAVEATSPAQLVVARARLKADAVAGVIDSGLVIGADTVVVVDDEILGKPRDAEEARRMLGRLSGRSHHVMTGVAVCPAGGTRSSIGPPPVERGSIVRQDGALVAYERTTVTMRSLTSTEIDRYVATGEPMDKAGAYGIQERGGLLVAGIVGDYFNVVGLPLALLRDMLEQFGVSLL